MNQASLRFSESGLEFYEPSEWRLQDLHNKQSSNEYITDEDFNDFLNTIQLNVNDMTSDAYKAFLKRNVGREMSRILLPQSLYSEFVWQQNLHNMLHLLRLRLAPDAQWETRQYAEALYQVVRPLFPEVVDSWENHIWKAVSFSSDEMDVVRKSLDFYASSVEGGLTPELAALGLSETRIREFYSKLSI